ncbi:MAG: hypothetical protein ACYS8W_08260 [Planctomycetota bacterium]|jgi:hypothetical protein
MNREAVKWNFIFIIIFALICVVVYFGVKKITDPDLEYDKEYCDEYFKVYRAELAAVKKFLLQYKAKYGDFPTNNEGLNTEKLYKIILSDPAAIQPGNTGGIKYENLQAYGAYNVKNPRGTFSKAILADSGLLSVRYVPYIYENRRCTERAKFTRSVVDDDPDNFYSIKVADGIYVWSIGAYMRYSAINVLVLEKNTAILLTAGGLVILALIFFTLYIYRYRTENRKKPKSIPLTVLKSAIGISAIAGASFLGVLRPTYFSCYMRAALGPDYSYRIAEMLTKYQQILEKYREKGIIKQEVYDKLKAAMEKELLNQKEDSPVY